MSSIVPSASSYPGSSPSAAAWKSARGPAAGCPSSVGNSSAPQTPQITDQINITSITVNISEGTPAPGDGLKLELDKVVPTGTGASTLQPYAEGYYSAPTNFIPTGSDGATSSQATSDASITLQILNEAITSSDQANSSQSQSGTAPTADAGGSAKRGAASYKAVDISI
jgi:hypothetical protein